MLAAKEYPIKAPKASAGAAPASAPEVSGPGGRVRGGEPAGSAARLEPATAASQATSVESPQAMGYSYPFPFTRYEVFDSYTVSPYRKIGKVFFTQLGQNYVCSASSIGNRAIITAGHCLHSGPGAKTGWSTNVVFVPAYRVVGTTVQQPYGQWSCQFNTQRVFTVWSVNGRFNRDVGGCKLFNNASGKKISEVVGWLGHAWNWGDNEHYHATGYPAASPFTGGRQIICAASWATWDNGYGGSPLTQGIGCDMTGGSSGGPWLREWNSGGGFVNGVNSYKYPTSQPGAMYSPYFDSTVKTSMIDQLLTN
jgi:V8-like Glu-specific endopeptidase